MDKFTLVNVALKRLVPVTLVVLLNVTLPSRELPVEGDDTRLSQVVSNLVSNAIKYTPEGGRVSIRGDVTDGGAGLLIVRDTGIGIAVDDVKRIMEPFVQLESTMTRRFGGSGLGLAIARSLVEMHGARIAIDSQLGGGTTVTIAFPPDRIVAQ